MGDCKEKRGRKEENRVREIRDRVWERHWETAKFLRF